MIYFKLKIINNNSIKNKATSTQNALQNTSQNTLKVGVLNVQRC